MTFLLPSPANSRYLCRMSCLNDVILFVFLVILLPCRHLIFGINLVEDVLGVGKDVACFGIHVKVLAAVVAVAKVSATMSFGCLFVVII